MNIDQANAEKKLVSKEQMVMDDWRRQQQDEAALSKECDPNLHYKFVQQVFVKNLDISMGQMIWLTIKAIPAIAIGSVIFFGIGYLVLALVMSGVFKGF